MGNVVTSQVLQNDKRAYKLHLTCISDGTNETNVVKVDKSTLQSISGGAPSRLDIASVRWNIQGMGYVKLAWDHTTPDTALVLSGNGYDSFSGDGFPEAGGVSGNSPSQGLLKDPQSAGGTGNLLLTTFGATGNSSYDITLNLWLVP